MKLLIWVEVYICNKTTAVIDLDVVGTFYMKDDYVRRMWNGQDGYEGGEYVFWRSKMEYGGRVVIEKTMSGERNVLWDIRSAPHTIEWVSWRGLCE